MLDTESPINPGHSSV